MSNTQFQATILPYGGTIHVRQLLPFTPQDLLLGLPRRLTLIFDDNSTLETTGKKTYYSSFFWQIYPTFPNTPLLQRHFVDHVLRNAPLNSGTHALLAEGIVRDVEAAYQLDTPEKREILNRYIYKNCCEDIHNQVSKATDRYVAPIDILDVIELAEHPAILEARSKTTAHADSITSLYNVVDNVVKNDASIKGNALVKALQAKIVNFQQVCQTVAARGFPTEINGTIFRVPITGNYLTGLTKLYDFAADSCGARKALKNAEAPLQDAEYFARRLQLLAMVVEKIAPVDCGSTKYLNWVVKPPTFDDSGNKVYSGDLEFMKGKYYVNDTTNLYTEITGDDPSLYGKVLRIRSGIYCKHPDPHSICQVCFGRLSRNISRFANLGHLCAATMTQQTSQAVLSTKHLVASGVGAPINLTSSSSKFFCLTQQKNAYLIKKELFENNAVVKVIIPRDDAMGLMDVVNLDNVDDIGPDRISCLSYVGISIEKDNTTYLDSVEIQQGSRQGIMTSFFVKYLSDKYQMTQKWTLDDRNNFIFDLSDWDPDTPIFMLPQMEYSYSEHSREIAKKIESSMKNITDREKPDSPASTLQQLFTLVNTKLNVNLAALEVLVYASMLPSKHDYSLARNAENPTLGVSMKIISNRSLGAAYAYERHRTLITNPQSFIPRNRPDSVFDVFIDPRKVVDQYRVN